MRRRHEGPEHQDTLLEAGHYASSLLDLKRFEEAKSLLLRTIPVARRVLGDKDILTLGMRWNYAVALYKDNDATLRALRKAVSTLEEIERIAQRVLGGQTPTTKEIECELRAARAALRAREETPPSGSG